MTVNEDNTYNATEDGVVANAEFFRKLEAKPKPENVVRGNLFQSSGLYDGAELRKVAYRPGAFDYLNCPSIINGVAQPVKA